jgi:ribose/xylose/arabinose/galactoside ABC-type transport system permease subunit
VAGQEAVGVAKARGVDLTKVSDAQVFLIPPFIAAIISSFMLRGPMSLKISGGHGSYAPDELRRIYYDVVETGQQLGVPMPTLLSFKQAVDEMR